MILEKLYEIGTSDHLLQLLAHSTQCGKLQKRSCVQGKKSVQNLIRFPLGKQNEAKVDWYVTEDNQSTAIITNSQLWY